MVLVRLLTSHQNWFDAETDVKTVASQSLKKWLSEVEIQGYLDVHRHQGVLWFNKEQYESFLWWMYTSQVVQAIADHLLGGNSEAAARSILKCREVISILQQAEVDSGFQVEKLVEAVV